MGPERHGNRESCSVTMNEDVSVIPGGTFNLETCCDHLMIGGVDVESANAVPGSLSAGDTFTWSSDFSVSREGWQLCFSNPTGSSTSPTQPAHDDPTFTPTYDPTFNPASDPTFNPTSESEFEDVFGVMGG